MFQPIVPDSGLTGWRFLQRTYEQQFEVFNQSSVIKRDTDYFLEKIGEVATAEELVSDRRLLTVALGAFGLEEDINNRFFIQKVLEDGTTADDALAVRLADTRYREFSAAFGFGPSEGRQNSDTDFANDLIDRFQANSFEVAAGTQSDAMRVALYAQRNLADLAANDAAVDTKWFTIMGDPPMRQLFERALNLPTSIGQIDLDQQLSIFKDRSQSIFGSEDPSIFTQDDNLQDVITKYIVRDQIQNLGSGLSSGAIALSLLG